MKIILSNGKIKVRHFNGETKQIGYYQRNAFDNTWYANFEHNGITYERTERKQSDIRYMVSVIIMEG